MYYFLNRLLQTVHFMLLLVVLYWDESSFTQVFCFKIRIISDVLISRLQSFSLLAVDLLYWTKFPCTSYLLPAPSEYTLKKLLNNGFLRVADSVPQEYISFVQESVHFSWSGPLGTPVIEIQRDWLAKVETKCGILRLLDLFIKVLCFYFFFFQFGCYSYLCPITEPFVNN